MMEAEVGRVNSNNWEKNMTLSEASLDSSAQEVSISFRLHEVR